MNRITITLIMLFWLFTGMKEVDNNRPVIIYINDPLCSWCYGFSPEVTKLKEKYGSVADFRMVEAGLRIGKPEPLSEEAKEGLKEHWEQVKEMTGQPFSYDILNSEVIYDTEPACRAVITMRKLKPEAEFEYFKAIQNSFYFQNKSAVNIETFLELLPEGISAEEFTQAFNSEEVKNETKKDFDLATNLGTDGFPCILLKTGDKIKIITNGYEKFAKMEKAIDKELAKLAMK